MSDPQKEATIFYDRACVYIQEGNLEKALFSMIKSIELDPNWISAWCGLGFIYFSLKQYQDVIDTYKKAIELDPYVPVFWYELGNVHLELNQYQAAFKAYKVANELNPNLHYPWHGLGVVYSRLNQHQEAIDVYKKAIELDPSFPHPWFGLGCDYYWLKQYKKAIDAHNNAIELDPNFPNPWDGLGNVYLKLKQYKKAIDAYNNAIKLDPNFSYPWNGLGNVYTELKLNQKAKVAYKKAIELDPCFPAPWYGLGGAYIELNELDKPLLCYAKYELMADNEELRIAIPRLIDYYKTLDTNFLAFRIIKRIINWESFISYQDFFERTYETFYETDLFLQHLRLSNYQQHNSFEYDLIDGLLAFHLNDPIRAFKIFDEKLDTEESRYNMLVQYYLLVSSFDTDFVFKEFKAVKIDVMQKSSKILENPANYNEQQIYYTGLCWLFFDDPEKSLSCFELLPDFLPAKIHAICCRSQLGKDTRNQIELILSINQRTEFLKLLHRQGFNISMEPLQEVLNFTYRKEIKDSLGDIQAYVKENENLHPEIDWESLSCQPHKPFLKEKSKEQLAMDYKLIVNAECKKLEAELSSDSFFYIENFSIFLNLTDQALEDKIGNRIKEASKSLGSSLQQFLNTITYFHLSSKLNHKQKARLIYWLYAQYHISNKKDKSLQSIAKIILNLSFAYFCKPYVVALLFIPELMLPVFGEVTSFSIGKAVEKMLTNINEDFPETYDFFKERIDEIIDTLE